MKRLQRHDLPKPDWPRSFSVPARPTTETLSVRNCSVFLAISKFFSFLLFLLRTSSDWRCWKIGCPAEGFSLNHTLPEMVQSSWSLSTLLRPSYPPICREWQHHSVIQRKWHHIKWVKISNHKMKTKKVVHKLDGETRHPPFWIRSELPPPGFVPNKDELRVSPKIQRLITTRESRINSLRSRTVCMCMWKRGERVWAESKRQRKKRTRNARGANQTISVLSACHSR